MLFCAKKKRKIIRINQKNKEKKLDKLNKPANDPD